MMQVENDIMIRAKKVDSVHQLVSWWEVCVACDCVLVTKWLSVTMLSTLGELVLNQMRTVLCDLTIH